MLNTSYVVPNANGDLVLDAADEVTEWIEAMSFDPKSIQLVGVSAASAGVTLEGTNRDDPSTESAPDPIGAEITADDIVVIDDGPRWIRANLTTEGTSPSVTLIFAGHKRAGG